LDLDYFMWKYSRELGPAFCSTQLSTRVPNLTSEKRRHGSIHGPPAMRTYGMFTRVPSPKSQVPRPTHVSKSRHGGKTPTFEPQETIQMWLIVVKVGSWLVDAKIFVGRVLRLGSSFLLDPALNTSPKPHLRKTLPWKHPPASRHVASSLCLLPGVLTACSHGVPCPIHVSKSWHGSKVPTFEPSRNHPNVVNYR
jgi:hypothetical protein